jgi:hypothetical protein
VQDTEIDKRRKKKKAGTFELRRWLKNRVRWPAVIVDVAADPGFPTFADVLTYFKMRHIKLLISDQ